MVERQYTPFPTTFNPGEKIFGCTPTSVASERLFSTTCDIYHEKRNPLAPEQAEALMFVKTNFSLINGNYQC